MRTSLIKTVLEFALDGDTVQNLPREELPKLGIQDQEAIAVIRHLAKDGLVSLYVFEASSGVNLKLDPDKLSERLLSDRPYIFLGPSEKTLSVFQENREIS